MQIYEDVVFNDLSFSEVAEERGVERNVGGNIDSLYVFDPRGIHQMSKPAAGWR